MRFVSLSFFCTKKMLLAAHRPLLPKLGLRSWDRPSSKRTPSRVCAQASDLVSKKCQPCEADGGALQYMGLCQSMTRAQAEDFLQQASGDHLLQRALMGA